MLSIAEAGCGKEKNKILNTPFCHGDLTDCQRYEKEFRKRVASNAAGTMKNDGTLLFLSSLLFALL